MQIKSGIKKVSGIKDKYPVLDKNSLTETILPALSVILVTISPKFKDNPKRIVLVSSTVTTITSSKVTMLQVALGNFVREKKIIEYMEEYGVTSSYDEKGRFKISAVHHTSQDKRSMVNSKKSSIESVLDNFDAHLSAQSGLNQGFNTTNFKTKEKGPNHCNTKEQERETFNGKKKPNMSDSFAKRGVLPLNVSCNQVITVNRSKFNDFNFNKEIITKRNAPDFEGYNTKQMRDANQATKNKTKVIYNPLINKNLSDPSTILTAICNIAAMSHQTGQQVAVFTCNQQLFRVSIGIMWDDPARLKHFYPRIGGMCWLINLFWVCWEADEK